ncbi:hypothetical protein [Antribacter gilvus]|uniref:hypothetical protein n=1 Tax=Antribacter gilvus TaxID=2304675 RepID=UPI000F77ABAD|nr:hypothetical protein [Antribacter gilvus]
MATNLACVGLDVRNRSGFRDLVQAAIPESTVIARERDVTLQVWTDPSGARLVITTEGGLVRAVTISFAGPLGARMADVQAADGGLVIAEVLDETEEVVAAFACELEEIALLGAAAQPVMGPACIVGLGRTLDVFPDEDAFYASDASLMTFADQPDDDELEPMRFEPESFSPDGAFTEQVDAVGRLNGTVLEVSRRGVARTGQSFDAARVRTGGFEVNLCVPAMEVPMRPGDIVASSVYLVASVPHLVPRR